MSGNELPAISGILPSYVWIFLLVAVALCVIAKNIYSVVEINRKEKRYRAGERLKDADGKDITDVIADKVIGKMEPRLKEIEEKLQRDKNRLESHETAIANMNEAQQDAMRYQEVSCQALLAVMDHLDKGENNGEMTKAKNAMTDYLVHRRVVANGGQRA